LVDAVLPPPVVDRLTADPQIPSDVGDLRTGINQVENLAPELQRLAPSSHPVLIVHVTQESNNETPSNRGKTNRCIESQASFLRLLAVARSGFERWDDSPVK
jgi:hypothetical protein